MESSALRALEWDQIVEVVRGFAQTPLGASVLGELEPDSDPGRVSQLIAATTEGFRYLETNPAFELQASEDLETVLAALAIEGRALDAVRLLALAAFLDSLAATCAAIRRAGGSFPTLKALAENCGAFKTQIADVRTKIDPSGDVNDNASGELSRLRTQIRKQRARLRSTLESYLRGKETSKYLQEQVVSDRDGRYVLVVRSEHRAAIPGIIHGSSGSGASLYLEPLSTVEINNEIVALEQQEREEILRILRQLTDAFRGRPLELRQSIDTATALDVIQAKVRFAHLVGGVPPTLSADGRLELRAARHPLLIPGVIARLGPLDNERPATRSAPVPVDIVVIPPTTVLLITGPNTGGKTVALKTAGLSALMAQAGLFVPAADASAPGLPSDLRRHRRRAVDRGESQHLLLAHHQHRRNGPAARASITRAPRRAWRRHGSARRRSAWCRRDRPLPNARRDRDLDNALRCAQDLRRDNRWRDGGGVRLHGRHVRADVSDSVRVAGPQPGTRNGGPNRTQPRDHRQRATEPVGARGAAGRAFGESRRGPSRARARAPPGEARA